MDVKDKGRTRCTLIFLGKAIRRDAETTHESSSGHGST
jgi:hypothetical protein